MNYLFEGNIGLSGTGKSPDGYVSTDSTSIRFQGDCPKKLLSTGDSTTVR